MKYTLENTIECLLLVSDEPLSLINIIKILDDNSISKKQIEKAIDNLIVSNQHTLKMFYIKFTLENLT